MHKRLNRKQFLRLLISGTAALAAAPLLAGCDPEAAAPTLALAPTFAPAPATPLPSPSAPALSNPTLEVSSLAASATETLVCPNMGITPQRFNLRYDPAVKSRVVQAHLPGVWQADALSPEGLARLLDHAITRLSGVNDANTAWQALFKPTERIAIKVNTINGSRFWTHPALAAALTNRLISAGIPAENLLIYDREDGELKAAGYALNRDGPGVRCGGTNGAYSQRETVAGRTTGLSDLLQGVDALINLPLLKQHGMAGLSFALKNHYGSIDSPGSYHSGDRLVNGLAELNNLTLIREKTRLVIGDALEACLFDWGSAKRGDSILMSFDPVAHDTIGLQHYSALLKAEGGNPNFANQRAGSYLARSAELGLGAHDPNKIEKFEESLT